MSDLFILGGKTRLAKSLYAAAVARGRTTKVLCHGESERAALCIAYPVGSVADDAAGAATESIDIVVCAFGLAHPARPDFELHAQSLIDELRRFCRSVRTHPGGVHVILVSTVIALMPSRDRAYYSAFKNLAESTLANALRALPKARFSVLYPGRLVERRGSSGLSSWIATPRQQLAQRLLDLCDSGRPTAGAVGVDARLWLIGRLLRSAASAVLPSFRATPLLLRDGPPRD